MNNNFRKYTVDFKEIEKYLFKAKKDIHDAKKILLISEDISYKTIYDVMMKITLALMMSHGLRPRTKMGHHIVMVEFAKKMLGSDNEILIQKYDRMREKRHLIVYAAQWISKREAEEAIILAEKYFQIVRVHITALNP